MEPTWYDFLAFSVSQLDDIGVLDFGRTTYAPRASLRSDAY